MINDIKARKLNSGAMGNAFHSATDSIARLSPNGIKVQMPVVRGESMPNMNEGPLLRSAMRREYDNNGRNADDPVKLPRQAGRSAPRTFRGRIPAETRRA